MIVLPMRIRYPDFYLHLDADARRNFRCDLLAACTFSLFNVVFNQFYMPMAIDAGAAGIEVGLLAAAPAIGLILSPIWSAWVERAKSPKPFTIYPNLIARLLILLPALFGAPLVFVVAALVFHLLMGIHMPAYAALMTRVYPARYRGRLMGVVRMAMGLMMIPLAYVVGKWSDLYGPSGPLAAAAITGALAITAFFFLKESEAPPRPPVATKRANLREQWRLVRDNRELGIFLIATTFSGFGNILAQPLYQLVQKQELALSFLQIGIARTTYFACLLCAYLIAGALIDRMAARQVVLAGLVAYCAVPLLYGLSESFPVVIIGSGIQGFGDAIWDIGILAYVFRLAPGREAVVFGLHLLLFGIRGTIGPLLSTGLSGLLPYSVMFFAAAVSSAIGVAVFLLGDRGSAQAAKEKERSAAVR